MLARSVGSSAVRRNSSWFLLRTAGSLLGQQPLVADGLRLGVL